MRGLSSFRKWKCDRGGPKEELQAKSTVSDRARGESLQRETEGSLRQTELVGRACKERLKAQSQTDRARGESLQRETEGTVSDRARGESLQRETEGSLRQS